MSMINCNICYFTEDEITGEMFKLLNCECNSYLCTNCLNK